NNKFDVHMHYTSEPQLFEKQVRALSFGCVRVQNPAELERFLIGDAGKDKSRVVLEQPVKAYIEYYTDWIGQDGIINFGSDIYGIDNQMLAALKPKGVEYSKAN